MDREKFIKLMLMTTSSHDGECLNAIRMANVMLAKDNLSWREFVEGTVPIGTNYRSKNFKRYSGPEIDEWFDLLLQTTRLRSSFYSFLKSVHTDYEEKGWLTEKQYEAIQKAWLRAVERNAK